MRLFVFLILIFSLPVWAQNAVPELPTPIQSLVEEGAQIRYLGREHGMDGWLTIKNGQEQYFYVQPDRSAFVMGVMFDSKGEMITVDQVQRLRESEGEFLDALAGEPLVTDGNARVTEAADFELQSPSERLYSDLENSNWVPLGALGAPVLYAFIDPQCPHCKRFVEEIRDSHIEPGRVQLRMIPVGFREETRAQSAFLMATPNPQERFFAFMDGDENALPAKAAFNQQGVQRNLAVMQSWKLDVTPIVVYRGRDGDVKIVRGKPKDAEAMIADIGARS